MTMAKKATMRQRWAQKSPDPQLAALERAELLAAINQAGIGPQGLGGDTTALAVPYRIGLDAHITCNPVAVNLQCWARRNGGGPNFGRTAEWRLVFSMADYSFKTPLTESDMRKLRVGDSVLLDGVVVFGVRDAGPNLIRVFDQQDAAARWIGGGAALLHTPRARTSRRSAPANGTAPISVGTTTSMPDGSVYGRVCCGITA